MFSESNTCGTRGGRVRIEIAGADGLVPYGGSPLPFERDLEPGEEVAFKTTYRAVRPSGGKDDIVVTATFTENETGWTETTVDKATAVKVTVRPKVHAPENDKEFRHKFGIGEIVDCVYQPEAAAVVPVRVGEGTISEKVGSFEYRCPLRGETSGFGLSGGGAEYIPHTSVVEPHAVLAKDAWYEEREVSDGLAGGILLTMDLYVLPLDVSFSGVKVEEVPDIGGSHSGYFADTFFMSEWFHGVDQGAGDWHLVQGNNRFLIDEAGFKRALPQLGNDGFVSSNGTNGWENGNLTWDVPCGWADPEVKEGDDPVGTFANGARQVMTIDAQGTVEVRKHAKPFGVTHSRTSHLRTYGRPKGIGLSERRAICSSGILFARCKTEAVLTRKCGNRISTLWHGWTLKLGDETCHVREMRTAQGERVVGQLSSPCRIPRKRNRES